LRGPDALDEASLELQHALTAHPDTQTTCRPFGGGGGRYPCGLFASPIPLHQHSPVGAGGGGAGGKVTTAAVFHASTATFGYVDLGKTQDGRAQRTTISGSTTISALQYALQHVETKLHAKAFVHHYRRYGVEDDDIADACLRGWELLAAYGGAAEMSCAANEDGEGDPLE
jgi:hypothetical protein